MMNRSVSRANGPQAATITKDAFKAEIADWANRICGRPAELHIRPMQRKWGSCSTRGRVHLTASCLRLQPNCGAKQSSKSCCT
jgi:predicted metal-dependent hydrolase